MKMLLSISDLKPFGKLITPAANSIHLLKLNLSELANLTRQYQLIVIRGFKPFSNNQELETFCEGIGEIALWPFGKTLELVEQEDPKDHIFDHRYIPMHWDGMYRPFVPEFQVFFCKKAPHPLEGGKTTFTNTRLALKNSPSDDIELWRKATGHYKRKMEFYDSETSSPIITKHPFNGEEVIRYNEPLKEESDFFINPPIQKFSGLNQNDIERLHSTLKNALYAKNNLYAHEWQDGDLVLADNFTLLHGRETFKTKSRRHLQRVHIQSTPPHSNPGLESYL